MSAKNAIGAALLVLAPLVAISCTSNSSVTAPSVPLVPSAASGAGLVTTAKAGLQKVTLYFYNPDDGATAPSSRVIGMAIEVVATVPPNATIYSEVTGKHGDATFWIPASIEQIRVTTGTCAVHYNPTTGAKETETFVSNTILVDLPANTTEGWLPVHETVPNVYGCTLP